jgi:hypothetical protein
VGRCASAARAAVAAGTFSSLIAAPLLRAPRSSSGSRRGSVVTGLATHGFQLLDQLKDSPRHIRDYVDAIMEKRGRRFWSLSRVRAFARKVGGVVRRWHRTMNRRYMGRNLKATLRYETNPWPRVARRSPIFQLLPTGEGRFLKVERTQAAGRSSPAADLEIARDNEPVG